MMGAASQSSNLYTQMLLVYVVVSLVLSGLRNYQAFVEKGRRS